IVVDEMFATLAKWVKPTRSVAAGDDGARTNPLFDLPGIDARSGLANTGDDGAFYRRMLRLFREREADFVQRFRAARAAGDTTTAMRAVHDLKSAAGTLGMPALQDAAAALERDCLEGAPGADVDTMVHKVSNQLDEVIDELQALESTSAA
ncbi:MAG: Hpt domain-containing protein, partial [Burkholderiales bacterium]